MTLKEYYSRQQEGINKLNQIDLKPYLVPKADLYDIIDKVEEDYPEEDFFNCLDHLEFMEYLEKRYQIRFYEKIRYILDSTL